MCHINQPYFLLNMSRILVLRRFLHRNSSQTKNRKLSCAIWMTPELSICLNTYDTINENQKWVEKLNGAYIQTDRVSWNCEMNDNFPINHWQMQILVYYHKGLAFWPNLEIKSNSKIKKSNQTKSILKTQNQIVIIWSANG